VLGLAIAPQDDKLLTSYHNSSQLLFGEPQIIGRDKKKATVLPQPILFRTENNYTKLETCQYRNDAVLYKA
jgi:hypothetical protein